jgi:drug/metabolite transporter (DMT)-like permease
VAREPVNGRLWPALALSLAGLGVVARVWDGLAFDGLGLVAGFGAATCFAVYFLVGDHGIADRDPLHVILWAFLIAAVFLNVIWPVTRLEGSFLGDSVSLSLCSGKTIFAALGLGHFGVKLRASSDGGETWKDVAAPKFPEMPAGEESKMTDGRPWPWRARCRRRS